MRGIHWKQRMRQGRGIRRNVTKHTETTAIKRRSGDIEKNSVIQRLMEQKGPVTHRLKIMGMGRPTEAAINAKVGGNNEALETRSHRY